MSSLACYALRYPDLLAYYCVGVLATCNLRLLQHHWDRSGRAEGRTQDCEAWMGPSPEAVALQQAVRRGGVVDIAEGDIRFGNSSLLIEGAAGLQLRGRGPTRSRLWFEPGHGVQVVASRDVTLMGFSTDCPQAPFAQGRVVGASRAGRWVDFELEDGFPSPVDSELFAPGSEMKVVFWDPLTRRMRGWQRIFEPAQSFSRTAIAGDRGYRVQLVNPLEVEPRRGELITVSPRLFSFGSAPFPSFYKGTFLVLDSARVALTDVHIHCSATMTLLELGGEGGHVYRRVAIRRKPRPPYPSRLLATNSDGLHSFSVRRGPTLVDSFFEFLADDFLNVHNRVWPVVHVQRREVPRLLVLDPSSGIGTGLQTVHTPERVAPGLRLRIYDFKTRVLLAEAQVRDAALKAYVPKAQEMVAGISKHLGAPVLPFEEGTARLWQIDVEPRQSPENLFAAPYSAFINFVDADGAVDGTGTVVANNTFTDTYCNLMRIATSNVLIEGNLFDRGQDGIHVRFLPDFLEGGAGLSNITVRNNEFRLIRDLGAGETTGHATCQEMACLLQNVDPEVRPHIVHEGNRVTSSPDP